MPAPRLSKLSLLACCALLAFSQAAIAQDQPPTHVYPGAEPLHSHSAPADDASANAPAASQPGSSPDETTKAEGNAKQTGTSETEAPAAGDAAEPVVSSDLGGDQDPDQYLESQAEPHYALATHYFHKWELDLAELELDETVSIYPQFRIAHRDACLIAMLKLNFPRSLAEFMMVTGLADPVAYNEKDKKALDEKAMHTHYKRGLKWASAGNWHEAISEMLWAESYAPNDPAIHHSLAFAYGCAGDFQKAEEEYKSTFAEQPNDGTAHADFADFLADHGQSAKAEEQMREAVKLTPNAAALHVDLGWLAESRGELPEATSEFEQAVKLSPHHAGLWTHLGRLLEQQQKLSDAQQAYKRALAENAGYVEAQQRLKAVSDELSKPVKMPSA